MRMTGLGLLSLSMAVRVCVVDVVELHGRTQPLWSMKQHGNEVSNETGTTLRTARHRGFAIAITSSSSLTVQAEFAVKKKKIAVNNCNLRLYYQAVLPFRGFAAPQFCRLNMNYSVHSQMQQ